MICSLTNNLKFRALAEFGLRERQAEYNGYKQLSNWVRRMKMINRMCTHVAMLCAGALLNTMPVVGSPEVDAERAYANKLEKQFAGAYFPPQGWEFSDGIAQATLECDARIDHIIVIKSLVNPFNKRDKRPLFGGGALISALQNSSPVEPPPKTIRCPAKMVIEFHYKEKSDFHVFTKVTFK